MILIIRYLNASAISAVQSGTKITYHSKQDVRWIGVMWVGPRKYGGKARTKRYCGAGWMFQRPKWGVSRRKKLSTATEDCSSDDKPPSYIDASTQRSSFKGLPEIAAQFDPHDFDLAELVERFRDERSRERSERGSGALEMSHKGSGIVNKE